MRYTVALKIAFCFVLFSNNTYSQDRDSIEILSLEEIDLDHPNLSKEGCKEYYNMDINQLISVSEGKSQMIQQLFFSMDYYLAKDSCLSNSEKLNLVSTLDSLQSSFNFFLIYSQEVDYLSYGEGKQAGVRSLIYKISFQQEFILYLKYWFSSFYFVYLEPGVRDCD